MIPSTFTIENLLITDGPVTYTLADANNTICSTTIDLIPPAPCSDPCDVVLTGLNLLDCTDNNTGTDPTDDLFLIEVSVMSGDGAGDDYFLIDDFGNSYGPFPYDELITLGPLPANGEDINLFLVDDDNGSCMVILPTISKLSCSRCNKSIDLEADNSVLSCLDNDAIITVNSIETPVSFSWTGPLGFISDQPFITVTNIGTYNLVATFSDGCIAEDDISITSDNSIPISNIGPDILLNCDMPTATLTTDNSTLTATTVVEWLDDSGTIISTENNLEVTTPGTYGLILRDTATGCVSQLDEVIVTENFNMPAAIIFANPDSILNCFVQTIELTHDEEPNTLYTWMIDGSIIRETNIIAVEAATIQLTAIDTISDCSSNAFLTIEDLTAFPIIQLSDVPELACTDDNVCITVTSPTSNPITYQWFDEAGSLIQDGSETILCVENPGRYTVIATDTDNDCTNDESFEVMGPSIPEVTLPEIISLSLNETITLQATINIPEESIDEVTWITSASLSCTDCLEPQLLSYENGDVIELSIITNEGCRASAFTTIEVIVRPQIYIPNVFSPNLTGGFTIYTNEQIEMITEMSIYDRWGNLVFQNMDFPPNQEALGWNGRFDNVEAEQGVYVYLFVYELDGRTEVEAGDVTLIR